MAREGLHGVFNYPDHNGGFYYQVCPSPLLVSMNKQIQLDFMYEQRWGDAPVHMIGASLFGGKDGVHFFREIGYEHYPSRIARKVRCGSVADVLVARSETSVCGRTLSSLAHMSLLMFLCLDYHGGWSCLPKWERAINIVSQ